MSVPQPQNQPRQKPTASNLRFKNYVEVKLVTWNKDSHGLFDYESKSVDLKYIHVESPCEVYRLRKEQTAEGQREKEDFRLLDKASEENNKDKLNSSNSIFLVSIESIEFMQGQPKFSLNVFRDSLKTLPNNQLAQDPYLIVRSLKNDQNVQKGYDLKIGDIVKFGRIEYQVVQLRNQSSETQVKNIEKHIFQQKESIEVEGQIRTCKICLGEDEYEDDFFCNPCVCKGSCEFVHVKCLRNWIQSKLKCKTVSSTTVYSWKKSDCELCKNPLPKHINYKNQLYDLLDLQPPKEQPYIVLESIAKEKKVIKTLFLFTATSEVQEIKLGRGHQCEVRISDISVSRTHSFLKFQKGKFTIFDNNSKFGTLIKMNNNIEINSEKKAVQIGRTVVTFAQKLGQTFGQNMFQEKTEQKPVSQQPPPQLTNQSSNGTTNAVQPGSENNIFQAPSFSGPMTNSTGNTGALSTASTNNNIRYNQNNIQFYQQNQYLPQQQQLQNTAINIPFGGNFPQGAEDQYNLQAQQQAYEQQLNRNARDANNNPNRKP